MYLTSYIKSPSTSLTETTRAGPPGLFIPAQVLGRTFITVPGSNRSIDDIKVEVVAEVVAEVAKEGSTWVD